MSGMAQTGALGALVATILALPASADATVYSVTQATLVSAFKNAKAGDTLKLRGTFGFNRLQFGSFASTVTLDATAAKFTDTLDLQHDDNVRVVGGKWDVTKGSSYGKAIVVYGGSNIAVDKINVVGVDGEQGVNFAGVTNPQISNSTFTGLRVGIGISGATGGSAYKNKIYKAVSDGIDIGDSHNVVASYNSCSGGAPGAGVHPDCIQLWSTTGHAVQSDNVVTRNTATGPTQGFTSFSAGGGALRVQITHNTVNTTFPQGIACYDCYDSIISFNTLTTGAGAAHITNLNVVGGGNNKVDGNIIHYPVFLSQALATGNAMDAPDFNNLLMYNDYAEPVMVGTLLPFDALTPLSASGSAAAVPEPSAWSMLIAGFAAVGAASRRRTREVCA